MDWTAHFAKLFRDFLAAASAESGIPSALPKKVAEDVSKQRRPYISVLADPQKATRAAEWKGMVNVTLHIKLKEDGGEAADAVELLGKIRDHLTSDAAYASFIQSKPMEERTGWMILFRPVLPTESETDESERTRDYTVPISIHAITKR